MNNNNNNNNNNKIRNPDTVDSDDDSISNHVNGNLIVGKALEEEGEDIYAILGDASASNNNNNKNETTSSATSLSVVDSTRNTNTTRDNSGPPATRTTTTTTITIIEPTSDKNMGNQSEEKRYCIKKTKMVNDDINMDHTETETSTTDICFYSHHDKISEIKVKDRVLGSINYYKNKNDDVMLSWKQLERESHNTTNKQNTNNIRSILRVSETSNKDYIDNGSKNTPTGILRTPSTDDTYEPIHDRNNLPNDSDDNNNLAVAVPVTDDNQRCNDDEHLPTAIEMDPDEKNNLRNFRTNAARMKKRTRLLFFGSIIIISTLIGTIIGIVVSRQKNDTNTREQLNIPEYIISQLQTEDIDQLLNDPNSPYSKAMNWIVYQDPLQVTPYDKTNTGSNLFQRYILSYIYFATSVKRDWDWCAPLSLVNITGWNTTIIDDKYYNFDVNGNKITCRLLFHDAPTLQPTIKESSALVNWLSTDNECKWAGVTCDNQWNIRTLDISGFNMTGTFPEGVAYLQFLTEIHVSSGELEGTIPETHRLKHVERFVARQNKFTGNINETQGMRNLRTLYLQGNQLTGELPVDTDFWKDLKKLDLRDNKMVGQLPSATVWEQAKSFSDLMFSGNSFEGIVIPELFTANAELLEYIMVDKNKFIGTIPKEIGNCKKLYGAFFGSNNFTGPIPEEIYSIPPLQFLSLEQNQLTGTISPSIGNSTLLKRITLEGNELSGPVPTNLGNYDWLEIFNVDNNNLSGQIPIDLCQRGLIELGADCLPDISGVAQVICPSECCTKCCDAEGTTCQQMTTNRN